MNLSTERKRHWGQLSWVFLLLKESWPCVITSCQKRQDNRLMLCHDNILENLFSKKKKKNTAYTFISSLHMIRIKITQEIKVNQKKTRLESHKVKYSVIVLAIEKRRRAGWGRIVWHFLSSFFSFLTVLPRIFLTTRASVEYIHNLQRREQIYF